MLLQRFIARQLYDSNGGKARIDGRQGKMDSRIIFVDDDEESANSWYVFSVVFSVVVVLFVGVK